jgi:hypothetical protein
MRNVRTRSHRKVTRALPPLAPGALDQFKKRARDALSSTKAMFDYASAIYLRELKKQKYVERSSKGDAKKWWKSNLEDLCPYRLANDNLKLVKAFPKPDAEKNFAEFASSKLDLALRYCHGNGIDVPPDPRDLTVQFVDDDGRKQTKPFPQCAFSELLLAVHGRDRAPDSKRPGRKLDKDQQGMLDAARQSISGFIENPERRVVAEWEGEVLHFSVLKIPEGSWGNALDAMAQAVNAFIRRPHDDD